MKVYNSFTRKKEDFSPIKQGEVSMYACGVTPYDEIHIGHARQAVIYDVIRSYFEYLGYKVNYVRNFTDVDDKIINRANKEGKSSYEISEHFIVENSRDIEMLKVRQATHEPKVTDCINDIIDFIQGLIDKGYAYVVDGEVFFEINKFPDYGKLSNRNKDELINAEESPNKRHSGDFVLWKPKKEGEPHWTSPWSSGRPGWHIECSVMAYKYLGATIDIHGGGLDLIFPHHENELAQSKAYTGKLFAKYWIHNGLVMADGNKMSKSLGNVITVKTALEHYTPEEIRFTILSNSVRAKIDFSRELFLNARKRLYYFYLTLEKINFIATDVKSYKVQIPQAIADLENKFVEYMDNNFNTPKVIAEITEVFKELNKIADSKILADGEKRYIFDCFQKKFKKITNVLRLFEERPEVCLNQLRTRVLEIAGIDAAYIESRIKERDAAKRNKDWPRADRIKEELIGKGITLKDSPNSGTTWDIILK